MIYLDSSAALKLLVEEPESAALADWLTDRPDTPTASSELTRVEVVRAARRLDPAVVSAARQLVAQLDLIPVTTEILQRAAEVGEPSLRSLDAIHLASVLSLRAHLSAVVCYDHRLGAAVRESGLAVVQPGSEVG